MTLHSVGGRAFGLRGGEGTLAAGGKKRKRNPFMTWSGPRTQPPTPVEIDENERVARLIAGGHAALKHYQKEFPDMRSLDDFARHIAEVMTHWTERKDFTKGNRTLFYHGPSGTHVWRDPQTRDGGTALRPKNGKKYFDGQKE